MGDFVGVGCPKCMAGWYQDKPGQGSCVECPQGRFQNATGETECKECVGGKYAMKGSKDCQICDEGKYSTPGLSSCLKCDAGKLARVSKCQECDIGRYIFRKECKPCERGHACADGRKLPVKCSIGWYQSEKGKAECKICPAGHECIVPGNVPEKCKPGKYSTLGSVTSCLLCERGQFQDQFGASSCLSTSLVMTNNDERTGEIVDPIVIAIAIAVPSMVLALIYPFILIGKVIIAYRKAWKPQSKADAELAKCFQLPKSAKEVSQSIEAFKKCEKRLHETSIWDPNDINIINEHRKIVKKYLCQRVEHARKANQTRIMQCCRSMDVLHDFKVLYDSTMHNIRHKERVGFKRYSTVAKTMCASSLNMNKLKNPSGLFELYSSGRAVYEKYHDFIEKAANASLSAYTFVTHGARPGMKGIYRVLEKGVFKYNNATEEDELDLSQVRDLVRGGIIDRTMDGLAVVAEYIHNSNEVTICRIKDRFNEPSGAGWTDLMINFYLNSDPLRHVCEVQLIHWKMLSQRTTQEGHGAYNIFRVCHMFLPLSCGSWCVCINAFPYRLS